MGEGGFHRWAVPWGDQLWVNSDGDPTVSVVDLDTLTLEATIDIPADLVEEGGFPHDVVVDWDELCAPTPGADQVAPSEAGEVTVYDLRGRRMFYDSTLEVGLNPFGITHVPAWP